MKIHKVAWEVLRGDILHRRSAGWEDIGLNSLLGWMDDALREARKRDKEYQKKLEEEFNEAEDRQRKEWAERQERDNAL